MSSWRKPGNYTVLTEATYTGGVINFSSGSDNYLLKITGIYSSKFRKDYHGGSMDQFIGGRGAEFVLPAGWNVQFIPQSGPLTLVAKKISW